MKKKVKFLLKWGKIPSCKLWLCMVNVVLKNDKCIAQAANAKSKGISNANKREQKKWNFMIKYQ